MLQGDQAMRGRDLNVLGRLRDEIIQEQLDQAIAAFALLMCILSHTIYFCISYFILTAIMLVESRV